MRFRLKLNRNEQGSAIAEQILLTGLIAVIAVSSLTVLGSRIKSAVSKASTAIPGGTGMSGAGDRSD